MEIVINNLTKIIKGNVILDHISVKMNSGNIYGIQGINGSGKTMLMRAICGLILPTEGTVEVDKKKIGKDISFPDSVGLLLENPSFLPSYTAFENLKLLTSIKGLVSDEKITETLKAVGLEPKDKRKYKKFSLGMKQRLGIACAVVESPEIIILDEPFNALDEDGNKLILELLMQLRMQGKLIILSCHDKQELEMLSDKIFLIKSGKICKEESA